MMMNAHVGDVDDAPIRILVVDDDRLVLATLSEGLRRAGYEVFEAQSGEEGKTYARELQPDIAILDMRMPGLSGIDVAQWLQENTRIPFLFLSAYGDKATVADGVGSGALGYLVKPLDIQQLIPAVEAALARSRDIQKLLDNGENLELALQQGRQISTAIGVLMERHRISEQGAFERLRVNARSSRSKVHALADQVIQACEKLNALAVDPGGKSRQKVK